MKNYISIPVWGPEYRQLLTDYCLPALLGEGNLPKSRLKLTLFIYSPVEDWEVIKAHPVIKEIEKHCRVKHKEIESPGKSQTRHNHLNNTHNQIILDAIKAKAGVFMILPDQIFSKGTFKRVQQYIKMGKEVVMVPGLRVSFENKKARQDLLNKFSQFSTAECVDLFVKHMHFISAGCFWESEHFTRMPSNVYHYVGDQEIIGHIGHQHPLYLKHPDYGCETSTIDGLYIDQYNNKRELVQIVDDSSIIQLSLTDESPNYNWARNNGKACPLNEKKLIVKGFFKSWPGIHKWFGSIEVKFIGQNFKASELAKHFVKVAHSVEELKKVIRGEFE